MKNVLIKLFLSLLTLAIMGTAHSTAVRSPRPDTLKNLVSEPWKEGDIIYEYQSFGPSDGVTDRIPAAKIIERKFLGKTDKGYYVVQDFYQQSGKEKSNPLTFMRKDNITQVDVYTGESLDGEVILWLENGTKWIEGQYQEGNKQGQWTEWSENGLKAREGHFLNNKQQGLWTTWYPNEKQKSSEGQYQNGERVGLWTSWHWNGKKSEEGNFLAGKKHGSWTWWDRNSDRKVVSEYLNGEKQEASSQ